MKIKLILLLALISTFLYANTINLTPEEKQYLKNNPTLVVQGIASFPPFNFSQNGKTIGYTVDYLKLMEKYLDINFVFTYGKSFPQTIDMFKNKQIDILPHIARNKDREKFMEFTNFYHINYPLGVTLRKDMKISSFEQLKDKTIVVIDKAFITSYLKNNFPNQKLLSVSSSNEGVLAVANEKADAFIGSIPTMNFYIKRNWLNNVKTMQIEGIGIDKEISLPMGVQKENKILKSILEKAHTQIEYSEILKLQEKWLKLSSKDVSLENLTLEEQKYLSSKKHIKICVLPNWLPFEQIDENGNHKGIGHDILELLSEKLDKDFILIPTKEWADSLQNIRDRKCDILPVAMDIPSRRDAMNFTKPYVAEPFVIATTEDKFFIRDEKDLSNKKIGVVKSYAFIEVLKQKNPLINIVEVKDTKEGLDRVSDGELFGYIDTMPTIGYFIQKYGLFNLKIAGKLPYDIKLSIASRNDEPLLNSIMEKSLNTISQDEIRKIVGKWIEIKVHQEFDYTKLLYIVIFFSVIVLMVMYRNKKVNEQKNEFKQLIENSTDGVFVMDLDGNLLECSNKACEMLGYTKDEMLKLNIADWECLYSKDEIHSHLKDLTKKTESLKTKHKRKDGSIYDTEIYVSKIKLSDKELVYASVRDITMEKNLKDKILEQKEELETIFNYSQDGIVIVDLDSNFLKTNNTYLNMSGYTHEELFSKSYIELCAPADKRILKQALKDCEIKGYYRNLEITSIVKGDKRLEVNLSISLLPDKKSFIILTKDMTNLKILENQSRLASMGQMIGNIAHQWRQPLSVITTCASAIQLRSDFKKLDEENLKESLDAIMDQANYLSNTIDNFRNFIKAEKVFEPISLKSTIENTLSLTMASLKNNYIELILDIETDAKVLGNKNELSEAFLNIINNAKDILKEDVDLEEDRLIFLTTKLLKDNSIELMIKDSAGGIKEDIIKRIFEPYFTTKHQSQGTGLGLAIVDKIIRDRHKAIINVHNEAFKYKDKDYYGACFSIIFKCCS